MRTARVGLLLVIAASLLMLASCAAPNPPRPDPALNPAGPVTAPVDTIIDFQPLNFTGGVDWSVDGVEGGAPATGTISAGTYQAPERVPAEPTVTVTATDDTDATRRADAEVTITAQGTLYILDTTVYVYNYMGDTVGDVSPDRMFSLNGITNDYYDMAMAPALDLAFISVQQASPNVFRVSNISAASGTITGTALDTLTSDNPSGLAYDPQRDILYVLSEDGLMVFDDASVAPAGRLPSRVVAGPAAAFLYEGNDSRLSLDPDADRLFISNPSGDVGVYDAASTAVGDQAPIRTIVVNAPISYLWGSAYDSSRDELYLADQATEVGVYVLPNASTADGPTSPARSIGGPINRLMDPSQIGYDAANDRLVVIATDDNTVKVFDTASTVDGDVAPTRVIGGIQLPMDYPYSGYLDPTQ